MDHFTQNDIANSETQRGKRDGLVAELRPSHLQKLAQAFGIDVEELYAEAGYLVPGKLPDLGAYLRVKYGLGDDAVTRIEGYVEATRQAWNRCHEAGEVSPSWFGW